MNEAAVSVLDEHVTSTLRLLEVRYGAGVYQPAHTHPETRLVFVSHGEMHDRLPQVSSLPGTVVLRPAGDLHETSYPTESVCLCIGMSASFERRLAEFSVDTAQPKYAFFGSHSMSWQNLRRELHLRDTFSELAIECAVSETIIQLCRSQQSSVESRPPAWLEKVKDFLRDEISSPIMVADLVRLAQVHPTHLMRTFRRFEGCTIGEYGRRSRIQQAAHCLESTDEPIGGIAVRFGFADQSHFCRMFKRYAGVSPSAFRLSPRSGFPLSKLTH